MRSSTVRIAAHLVLLGTAAFAAAQNLVTNGSFETSTGPTIADWVVTPPATSGSQADYPTGTGISPYGERFLILDPGVLAPIGSATQDLATNPANGQAYIVSFAYKQFGVSNLAQSLLVTINIASLPAMPHTFDTVASTDFSTWQRGSFTFVGNGLAAGITFSNPASLGFADSDLLVDDVSIQAVPEPASLAALSLGMAALLRRRRQS